MRRGVWVGAALLLVVLVVLGSLYGPDDDGRPAPEVDTAPAGFRAVLDLLAAVDVPAARHRGAPDALAADAAAWWIAPPVCGADPEPPAWPGRAFVEGGGTAVVLLRRQDPGQPCRLADDLPLPPRDMVLAPHAVSVTGDLGPAERRLPRDAGLLAFQPPAPEGWIVRAAIQSTPPNPPLDRPLLIERPLGAGRLLVLADAQLFRNARLDAGDTAPLLADLVRDTGVPQVVDAEAALAVERNALAYLVRSPALAAFVGLLLVGLLLAWHGTLVPPRRLPPAGMGTPSVEVFVDALAGLYARTGDWAQVALRYRELTAARLRRHFGMSPETSTARLVARLARDARFRDGALDPLVAVPDVRDEAGLRAFVAGLDALVARAAS